MREKHWVGLRVFRWWNASVHSLRPGLIHYEKDKELEYEPKRHRNQETFPCVTRASGELP